MAIRLFKQKTRKTQREGGKSFDDHPSIRGGKIQGVYEAKCSPHWGSMRKDY